MTSATTKEELLAGWSVEHRQVADRVVEQMKMLVDGLEIRAYSVWRGLGFRSPRVGSFKRRIT